MKATHDSYKQKNQGLHEEFHHGIFFQQSILESVDDHLKKKH